MNYLYDTFENILQENKSSNFFTGQFGFEKENIRVTETGHLATTPHPYIFGDKQTHPYITTDFSESQIEMITPPQESIHEAYGFLETLHDLVSTNLNNEFLWPQSVPPILPENEDDIPVAQYTGHSYEQELYRHYLAKTYGKKRQLFSGIHFNISFDDNWLKQIFNSQNDSSVDYKQFKEHIYLKVIRNFNRFRWFLIALLGNSSVVHKSFDSYCVNELPQQGTEAAGVSFLASMRNSICGYRNKSELSLNYDSVQSLNRSIQKAIDKKQIQSEKENYSPIRLKTSDNNEDISHLEVRILDLNPLVKTGIDKQHAQIIHLFLLYCLFKKETGSYTYKEQQIALKNHNSATGIEIEQFKQIVTERNKTLPIESALAEVFSDIEQLIYPILPSEYKPVFQLLKQQVQEPKQRPGNIVVGQYKHTPFIQWNMQQAKRFLSESQNRNYNFYGLEDMELSTQLLLKEATLRGLRFEIIDREENFVKLWNGKKTEYIKQATKTSLDSYASVLMMENKMVTKQILQSAGISTPQGKLFSNETTAKQTFHRYAGKAIVVKPKSTNFGLGITIIKDNTNQQAFDRAIEIAFEHDNAIMIEQFEQGREYRMFVINNSVEGVLRRVPAKVIGNGINTIEELINQKNTNSLRGKGYKTPLEKIELGEAEAMILQSQSLNFQSVPAKGQTIYLRENSNISTGGDSIDYTDDIHPSYKAIAVKAAQALQVNITGLDMLIEDISVPATENNYSIIELNFNPAIHIHCHPFRGKNRNLDGKILDALDWRIARDNS